MWDCDRHSHLSSGGGCNLMFMQDLSNCIVDSTIVWEYLTTVLLDRSMIALENILKATVKSHIDSSINIFKHNKIT